MYVVTPSCVYHTDRNGQNNRPIVESKDKFIGLAGKWAVTKGGELINLQTGASKLVPGTWLYTVCDWLISDNSIHNVETDQVITGELEYIQRESEYAKIIIGNDLYEINWSGIRHIRSVNYILPTGTDCWALLSSYKSNYRAEIAPFDGSRSWVIRYKLDKRSISYIHGVYSTAKYAVVLTWRMIKVVTRFRQTVVVESNCVNITRISDGFLIDTEHRGMYYISETKIRQVHDFIPGVARSTICRNNHGLDVKLCEKLSKELADSTLAVYLAVQDPKVLSRIAAQVTHVVKLPAPVAMIIARFT